MALVCLCRGNFYWPPHTTILFCSIFLDKIVLDTLKSRYHRSAPLGIPFILLNIVDCTVAAVCKFINFAVAFANHAAKLKALAETAHAAEKIQKGHWFIHRL